jgi:uncharacterized protein YegJ (DUF2314 family)
MTKQDGDKAVVSEEHEVVFSRSPGGDTGMRTAMQAAQKTLPLFWREVHWERHRIIPFMDLSVLKVAFSDEPGVISAISSEPAGDVEYMWVTDVNFDGIEWTGTLASPPMALTSVQAGVPVAFTTERVADWNFSMVDQVMGGFTTQHLRSKMTPAERVAFDQMQGLDFGDPANVQLVAVEPAPYPTKKTGLLKKKSVPVRGPIAPIGQDADAILAQEHGMAVSMAERFEQDAEQQAGVATYVDPEGFSTLHRMALAGATRMVELLLQHGADRDLRTPSGLTALDLANSLGWSRTAAVLQR